MTPATLTGIHRMARLEQSMTALAKANNVRCHMADAKKQLARRRLTVAEILADPMSRSMKIHDLLMAVPKVGRVKAARTLQAAAISPSKTLGGLTERQRIALLLELHAYPAIPTGALHRAAA